MHEHESNICLTSLVIGAVAGAGVALLMAPRPGSETRRCVSGKVREEANHPRDLASRAKERGRHLAEAEVEKSRGTVESVARESRAATPLRDYASVLDYRGL